MQFTPGGASAQLVVQEVVLDRSCTLSHSTLLTDMARLVVDKHCAFTAPYR